MFVSIGADGAPTYRLESFDDWSARVKAPGHAILEEEQLKYHIERYGKCNGRRLATPLMRFEGPAMKKLCRDCLVARRPPIAAVLVVVMVALPLPLPTGSRPIINNYKSTSYSMFQES
jgi:hypothetical protein